MVGAGRGVAVFAVFVFYPFYRLVYLGLHQQNRSGTRERWVGIEQYTEVLTGSDFLDAMERELRANGSYSDQGWKSRGSVNAGMATDSGVPFKSWNFEYDPTLDDLDLAKRAYIIDMAQICLYYMQGEKKKKVSPARPYNRFVMYNSVTTTAVMTARQLNTSMVIDIA